MKVIDNRDFLISEIESRTAATIKQLEKDHKKELADIQSRIKAKTKEEVSKLKESHKKLKERIRKQEDSSLALYKEKSTIRAQADVHKKVMQKAEDIILSTEKSRFFEKIAADIDLASDKKIKSYVVPKGVRLKGRKTVEGFDGIGVVGVIDSREEIEVTLQDMLERKSVEVNRIMEELF